MAIPFVGPAGSSDTLLFLTTDDAQSVARAIELWDQYSGAPGLLAASRGEPGTNYTYDPDRRVYVNNRSGLDVTAQQLRRYVRNVSEESTRRAKKNTQQLIAGIIILSVWYDRMRDVMKALYKTIWLLGIGGFVFDDDFARNLFYLFVLFQFSQFDKFAEQLFLGTQPIDGFTMTRAGMYTRAGNGMWQNILLIQAEGVVDAEGRKIYTEARRVLGPTEDHCRDGDRPGCIEWEALGWMPIDQMLPIGENSCYSNCQCRIIFR